MAQHVAGEDPALDAETRVPVLVGTSVAFTAAAVVVVLLRLYTRYAVVHSPGIDDHTIVLAAILSIGVSVCTIMQAENGLGRHTWVVSDEATLTQLKSLLAVEVLYNMSQIMTKISFLLQYRRIFQDNFTTVICFWLILFLLAWGITQEFLVCFACIPLGFISAIVSGHCINSLMVWYLTSVMNIITDFVVFIVPIPAILRLHLPMRQKILTMSLFCLGFFTCIISVVRLFTLHSAQKTGDASWTNSPTAWWTTIELNCGILCTSIVTLRPLFRSLASSSERGSSNGTGYERQSTPTDSKVSVDRRFVLNYVKTDRSSKAVVSPVAQKNSILRTWQAPWTSYEMDELPSQASQIS